MRVAAIVMEVNAKQVAFSGPDRWTRDTPMEGPGGGSNAWPDLDIFVGNKNIILTQRATSWESGNRAIIEIR